MVGNHDAMVATTDMEMYETMAIAAIPVTCTTLRMAVLLLLLLLLLLRIAIVIIIVVAAVIGPSAVLEEVTSLRRQ